MPTLLEDLVTERATCRVSGSSLVDVFSLGSLPFSTFLTENEGPLPLLPLDLCVSLESGLVQLRHSVNPDAMYNHYWYFSGVNQSMRLALESVVQAALQRVPTPRIVVDIASNDGTLLSAYPESVFRVGIDPAKNIKPMSCDLHLNTYFSGQVYREAMGGQRADIVTSIAMFYDLEDPISFAQGVASILRPGGLWIIELSYLPTMLEQNSFDTICSEHLEYYSLQSIEYILKSADLSVEDVELNRVNGGSFRLYIRHKGYAQESSSVAAMRAYEAVLNLRDPKTYHSFGVRVEKGRQEVVSFLEDLKKRGKKVFGYGASTKGNTIMAYYGIGPDLISCVADRNPLKHGRRTVTGVPIISEEEARSLNPDFFFAFPYHFMDEFLSRESDFIRRGGQFITPIPRLACIPKEGLEFVQNRRENRFL